MAPIFQIGISRNTNLPLRTVFTNPVTYYICYYVSLCNNIELIQWETKKLMEQLIKLFSMLMEEKY